MSEQEGLSLLAKYATSRSATERLTLVGPDADRKALYAALDEGGYRVVRGGPYTDAALWPEVDCSRFLVVAEREIEVAVL